MSFMKKGNLFILNNWFRKAEEDLKVAELIFKDGVWFGQVCFHSQQAVEKYLKGLLTLKNIKFPKTHSLLELMDLCLKVDRIFKQFEDKFRMLDAYYIGTRYPMPEGKYFREDAEKALKFATELTRFVEKQAKLR